MGRDKEGNIGRIFRELEPGIGKSRPKWREPHSYRSRECKLSFKTDSVLGGGRFHRAWPCLAAQDNLSGDNVGCRLRRVLSQAAENADQARTRNRTVQHGNRMLHVGQDLPSLLRPHWAAFLSVVWTLSVKVLWAFCDAVRTSPQAWTSKAQKSRLLLCPPDVYWLDSMALPQMHSTDWGRHYCLLPHFR